MCLILFGNIGTSDNTACVLVYNKDEIFSTPHTWEAAAIYTFIWNHHKSLTGPIIWSPIRHGPLIKFSPNHCEWSQEWCTIFTAGDEIIAAHSHTRRKMHLSLSFQSKRTRGASAPASSLHNTRASQACVPLFYIGAGIYKKCKFITRFLRRTHHNNAFWFAL